MYFVAKNISGHKLLGLKLSNPYFFMNCLCQNLWKCDQLIRNKNDRHDSVTLGCFLEAFQANKSMNSLMFS